jgi:hypothetical protein
LLLVGSSIRAGYPRKQFNSNEGMKTISGVRVVFYNISMGALCLGLRNSKYEAGHSSPSSAMVNSGGALPLFPPYIFMA